MIIEISVAIAVLAFVVLVVYLIKTLCSLRKTLDQARYTLQGINELKSDLEYKAKSLNPLFDTFSLLGEKALEKAGSMTQREIQDESEDKLTNILEWVTGGIRLWCAFKKRR